MLRDRGPSMNTVFKFTLLFSAFIAIASLDARQIVLSGKLVRILDTLILVNDLGVNARVKGQLYAPGTTHLIDAADLRDLKGVIKVEKLPAGELGYISYQTIPEGYSGPSFSSMDADTVNLSSAFAPAGGIATKAR